MNKKISTLLAAFMVAGSFGSTYAQLDGRNIEWKDAKAERAYYLAGIHWDGTADYLQALTLDGLVLPANGETAETVISETATKAEAQWTIETKKVGTVTQYALKNIEKDQYLAFEKKDGVYVLAAKKEANDETKSFRWFTVNEVGRLQAVLPSETGGSRDRECER